MSERSIVWLTLLGLVAVCMVAFGDMDAGYGPQGYGGYGQAYGGGYGSQYQPGMSSAQMGYPGMNHQYQQPHYAQGGYGQHYGGGYQ